MGATTDVVIFVIGWKLGTRRSTVRSVGDLAAVIGSTLDRRVLGHITINGTDYTDAERSGAALRSISTPLIDVCFLEDLRCGPTFGVGTLADCARQIPTQEPPQIQTASSGGLGGATTHVKLYVQDWTRGGPLRTLEGVKGLADWFDWLLLQNSGSSTFGWLVVDGVQRILLDSAAAALRSIGTRLIDLTIEPTHKSNIVFNLGDLVGELRGGAAAPPDPPVEAKPLGSRQLVIKVPKTMARRTWSTVGETPRTFLAHMVMEFGSMACDVFDSVGGHMNHAWLLECLRHDPNRTVSARIDEGLWVTWTPVNFKAALAEWEGGCTPQTPAQVEEPAKPDPTPSRVSPPEAEKVGRPFINLIVWPREGTSSIGPWIEAIDPSTLFYAVPFGDGGKPCEAKVAVLGLSFPFVDKIPFANEEELTRIFRTANGHRSIHITFADGFDRIEAPIVDLGRIRAEWERAHGWPLSGSWRTPKATVTLVGEPRGSPRPPPSDEGVGKTDPIPTPSSVPAPKGKEEADPIPIPSGLIGNKGITVLDRIPSSAPTSSGGLGGAAPQPMPCFTLTYPAGFPEDQRPPPLIPIRSWADLWAAIPRIPAKTKSLSTYEALYLTRSIRLPYDLHFVEAAKGQTADETVNIEASTVLSRMRGGELDGSPKPNPPPSG